MFVSMQTNVNALFALFALFALQYIANIKIEVLQTPGLCILSLYS